MNKSILTAIISTTLLSGTAFSADYTVPSGWQQKESFVTGSTKLYKKDNDNFFVVAVDISKAKIKVGGVNSHYSDGTTELFYTDSIDNYWDNNINYVDIYNSTYQNLFAVLNGQFFDNSRNPTGLSFPVKSNGIILTDNNGEDYLAKRSLVIDSNGSVYITEGVPLGLLDSYNSKEFITGLHPDEDKNGWAWFVGRNYIGGIPKGTCDPSKTSCSYEYILFFVNQDAKQSTMESEIAKWGVPSKSIIMMDGSGSAQMKTRNYSVYGNNGQSIDKRYLPNTILIYGK